MESTTLVAVPRPRTVNVPQLTDVQHRAMSLTGKIVTVDGAWQGKVICVEGDTWTTIAFMDGSVSIDLDGTYLSYLADTPRVIVDTGTTQEWVGLDRVSRGICLAKGRVPELPAW